MAVIEMTASGAAESAGAATTNITLTLSAAGTGQAAGGADLSAITATMVTQAGLGADAGSETARVTQAGMSVDSGGETARVTQMGLQVEAQFPVEAHVTQAGLGADVASDGTARVIQAAVQIDARKVRPPTEANCWEFHVYDRVGNHLVVLDGAVGRAYLAQLNDTGSGSFDIHEDDPDATPTILAAWNIVRVRYRNVDVGAFLVESVRRALVTEREGAGRFLTVSGRGRLASLAKGIVYPSSLGDASTVNRNFTAATRADIFLTLYNEFVTRGGGDLTPDFTDAVDSDAAGWADSNNLGFKAGTTLLDVLRQLAGFGTDFTVDPDGTLHARPAQGDDLSDSIIFREGRDLLDVDFSRSVLDQGNAVLGEGQNLLVESTSAGDIATYGRREAYLPVHNTADTGQIGAANSAFLSQLSAPAQSYQITARAEFYRPFIDYNVGDTVRVVVPGKVDQNFRILAIAVSERSGPCDLEVVLTVNTLELEHLIKMDKVLRASRQNVSFEGTVRDLARSDPRPAVYTEPGGGGVTAALDDLSDVTLTGPIADNELLAYDSGSSAWINQTAAEAGLATAGHNHDGTYVRVASADTITAVHTFNPTVAGAPFALGANASGQLVTGLNADLLDGQHASDFASASHNHDADYVNVTGDTMTGALDFVLGAAGTDAVTAKVVGDTQVRVVINTDGTLEWGPGNAALDTNLYRTAADRLKTNDDLHVLGVLAVGSTFPISGYRIFATGIIGASGATGAVRHLIGSTDYVQLQKNTGFAKLTIVETSSVDVMTFNLNEAAIYGTRTSGYRLTIGAGSSGALLLESTSGTSVGGIWWSTDTNLYRSAADTLRTGDSLHIDQQLGVGTTTPTTVFSASITTKPIHLYNGTSRADLFIGGNPANFNLYNPSGAADDRWFQFNLTSTGIARVRSLNDANTATIVDNLWAIDINTGEIGINTSPVSGMRLAVIAGSTAALNLTSTAGTSVGGILWGTDTNLYRSAADVLKTDDSLAVGAANRVVTIHAAPAVGGSKISIVDVHTISSAQTDGFVAALDVFPEYTAASAQTVTRHNYFNIRRPTLTNVTLTDACLFRFPAAAGTHEVIDGSSTKASPGTVNAWLKVNVNGTVHYIPMYTSKTS